jgi:hypothetical protein
VQTILQLFTIIFLTIFIGTFLRFARTNQSLLPTFAEFTIQITISLIFFNTFGLVEDEITYHDSAIKLMSSLDNGMGFQNFGVSPGKESFTYILGTIYFLFEPNPIMGLLFNAILMSIIPTIMVIICKNFGLFKVSQIAAWLVVFFPSLAFWGSGLRRESLAFLLVSLSLLTISMVYKNKYLWAVFFFVPTTLIIQMTRPQLLYMLFPGLATVLVLNFIRIRKELFRQFIIKKENITILFLLVFTHLPFLVSNYDSFRENGYSKYDGYLQEIANSKFETSINGVSWSFNSSPMGYMYNIFRASSGPPFWEWSTNSMVIFGLEGLVYLAIWIMTLKLLFTRDNEYRRQFLVLIACCIPMILASALIIGNYGINSRVRAHYFIPIIPIISIYIFGMNSKLKTKNLRRGLRNYMEIKTVN